MLVDERQYYDENLAEWLNVYPGRFVLIKGRALISAFDTFEEAISQGARLFGLEPVLNRLVQPQQEVVDVPALT